MILQVAEQIDSALGSIIELGAVFAVLMLVIVFGYRFFSKQLEQKEQQYLEQLKIKQDIIKQKDDIIQSQFQQLSDLVAKDIEATTKIDQTLNLLLNVFQNGR